jgi:hypothetical protein
VTYRLKLVPFGSVPIFHFFHFSVLRNQDHSKSEGGSKPLVYPYDDPEYKRGFKDGYDNARRYLPPPEFYSEDEEAKEEKRCYITLYERGRAAGYRSRLLIAAGQKSIEAR